MARSSLICCLMLLLGCRVVTIEPEDELGEARIAVSASDLKWLGEIEYEIWRGKKLLVSGTFTEHVNQMCGEEGTHVLVPGGGPIRLIAKSSNGWEWEFEHDDEGLPGCFKPRLNVNSAVTSVNFFARYSADGIERGIPLTVSDEHGVVGVAEKFASSREIDLAMREKGWSGLMDFWDRGEVIMIIRPPGRYLFTFSDSEMKWSEEIYFAPSWKSLSASGVSK